MANMNGIGRRQARPRVIIARRVVRKMAQGAALYPEEETAEALVGLVIPNDNGEPDLYVLDTIAPSQDFIDREGYMVEQGDDLQDETMYWLAINWRRFREMRRSSYGTALAAKWDAPLRYLGDWHKQPGEMFWPSQGDLETAKAIIMDEGNDMPQILAPIVTYAPPWDEVDGPPGDEHDLYATQDDGPTVRINFWYLSREMREFVAAKPEVVDNDMLPNLPPRGWHLIDRDRFQTEYDMLSADGLAVSITEWDADSLPPMEICFMAGRMGGSQVLILVTDHEYPAVAPRVRIAPMLDISADEDMFERLWEASEPYPTDGLPDWSWDESKTLLDLVHAVEAQIMN
jgi:hypothetical protein